MMLIMLVIISIAENGTAQERFFTSPNRGGAEGARQSIQLQQETNRGIAHQISITALQADLSTVSATTTTRLSDLAAAVTVSLTSAGDVSCGNQGMLMGPSHTIAVGKCIPALTIAPMGRVVLTSGLKLGPEGNCDGAGAGTMRYEAAQKVVQFCDGTSWQEVGASPTISGPFTAVTGANLNTAVTSNAITVSGFAGTRTATATGGAILLVNGVPQGATANVSAGNTVALQVISSSSYDTAVNVGFSATSIVANWSVTTRAQDTTPNTFTFAALSNQAVSTTVTSANATLSGFDGPLTATVSGSGSPQVRVGAESWASSVSVNPGDTIAVRLTTANAAATATGASVTVGAYSTSWNVTTESYGWTTSAWGSCSASCGGGTQTRAVDCRGATTNALAPVPAWCTGVAPGTSQSCNTAPCACTAVGQSFQGGTCVATGAGALIAAPSDAPNALGWDSAVAYCANLVSGGYGDWYLPARDELTILWQARGVLAGLTTSYYWSSTEGNARQWGMAWGQLLNVGNQNIQNKHNGFSVRCVRRAN